MSKRFLIFFIFIGIPFVSCKEAVTKSNKTAQKFKKEIAELNSRETQLVYESENLVIKKLSKHIYEHVSFLQTEDYGKVPCNGMLVVNDNKGILFDTPTDNPSSSELIKFVTKELKCELIALTPTHFHEDCIGGIQQFEAHNIPTYASKKTVELLKKKGSNLSKPIQEFDNSLQLNIGDKKVFVAYFGEGHTSDNVIGYFPEDNAIFGGCLIKKVGASKGHLGDANTNKWSETVRKIKLKYPDAKIVIPGHGKWGGTELFDYTIELFE